MDSLKSKRVLNHKLTWTDKKLEKLTNIAVRSKSCIITGINRGDGAFHWIIAIMWEFYHFITRLSTFAETFFNNSDKNRLGAPILTLTVTTPLNKGLSLYFMCSDQHVKYWIPRGFPMTSSLLLNYHVKQYIHLANSHYFSVCVLLVLHATPDSLRLDNWGTWRRC